MKNKVKIEEVEQNVNKISYKDGKVLYLVGTAHISEESKDLVEKTINEYKPDTVSVELDELRFEKMMKKSKYEDINIFQIIKKKQLFFFIGQFILGSFQKKMAKKTKSKPGEEFKKAVELANENEAEIVLADRNIGITLKRAWRLTKFWDKIKLIGASFFGSTDEDIDKDKIEEMKKADAIEEMVKGFADELPDAKKVLIDERDTYLGYKIVHNLGKVTVAVVGAGHVNGILKGIKDNSFPESLDDISEVPPAGKAGKIIPWVIPIAVMALFVWGFTSGRTEMAQDVIIYWVLANGILTAIGCLIAFGHPLTVIAGFIAACPISPLKTTHERY